MTLPFLKFFKDPFFWDILYNTDYPFFCYFGLSILESHVTFCTLLKTLLCYMKNDKNGEGGF